MIGTVEGFKDWSEAKGYEVEQTDDQVQTQLVRATAKFEALCRRTIEPREDQELHIVGNGRSVLPIPDMVEITEVSIGGSVVAATEYAALPAAGYPKQALVYLNPVSSTRACRYWTKDVDVMVKGTTGYAPAVPADIEEAVYMLVANELLSSGEEAVRSVSIQGVSVTFSGEKFLEMALGAVVAHRAQ